MFLDWSSAILIQSSGPFSGSFSAPTQDVLVPRNALTNEQTRTMYMDFYFFFSNIYPTPRSPTSLNNSLRVGALVLAALRLQPGTLMGQCPSPWATAPWRRARLPHGDGPGCGAVGEVRMGACGGQAVEGVFVLTVVGVVGPSASGCFLWTGRAVNIDVRQEPQGGDL